MVVTAVRPNFETKSSPIYQKWPKNFNTSFSTRDLVKVLVVISTKVSFSSQDLAVSISKPNEHMKLSHQCDQILI